VGQVSGEPSSEKTRRAAAATVLVALNKASNTDYSIRLLHFRQWIGDAARAVIYLIAISSRANQSPTKIIESKSIEQVIGLSDSPVGLFWGLSCGPTSLPNFDVPRALRWLGPVHDAAPTGPGCLTVRGFTDTPGAGDVQVDPV
jgi:hypothetical protein